MRTTPGMRLTPAELVGEVASGNWDVGSYKNGSFLRLPVIDIRYKDGKVLVNTPIKTFKVSTPLITMTDERQIVVRRRTRDSRKRDESLMVDASAETIVLFSTSPE